MIEIDTYLLVEQWPKFQLLMIFPAILNLNSKSTDFSNTISKSDMEGSS